MSQWTKLSRKTQFRIAVEVARRRGASLARTFTNVICVGAGFRSRGGEESLFDEVCLRFLVKRKWKSRLETSNSIPKYIRAHIKVAGKQRQVLIPTDVSEFHGGAPHLDLSGGITSRRDANPLEFGAGCCLVRNAFSRGERYLLSCYHVFSPSLSDAPPNIDCVISENGEPIGPMIEMADPESSSNALDAALALVEDVTVDNITAWGRMPTSRATDFDLFSLVKNYELFVHGRRIAPASAGFPAVTRTGPLPATFQSLFPTPLPFDYRQTAGKVFFFADTLQYIANVRPGDSGAAVMDSKGKLFGMHFYGQGNVGFAFSAPRLFDPGVFHFDITLT